MLTTCAQQMTSQSATANFHLTCDDCEVNEAKMP